MFSLPVPAFPVSEEHVCISLPGHGFPRAVVKMWVTERTFMPRPEGYSTDLWLVTSFYGGLIHRTSLFGN